MKFIKSWTASVMLFILIAIFSTPAVKASAGPTIDSVYPGLATDILKFATLAKLGKGTLLTAGNLVIRESEVLSDIKKANPAIRKQLEKNAFFILESTAAKRLLLQEAVRAGFKRAGDENKVIGEYLNQEVKIKPVSVEELKAFYTQNKDLFGNAPFEQVQGPLKDYLMQQKKQEAVLHYIRTLGQRQAIQVDEDWVKKQSLLALDNPVDKMRLSGKPSLVDFGATGCGPCDMMTPILANLEKKYKDKLNVLFVHVGQEQILGARYGIRSIPVQVFFDKNGTEVFRHTGFFPEAELEKKLAQFQLP